jgi:hypothetical protein
MRLTDQHGATAYVWFPPGTPTEPARVLPGLLYTEVCRLAGVAPSVPWVAFKTRGAALTAVTGAWVTVAVRAAGANV